MLTWTSFENIQWMRKANCSTIMCHEKKKGEKSQTIKMLSHICVLSACVHREYSGGIKSLLTMLEEKSCDSSHEELFSRGKWDFHLSYQVLTLQEECNHRECE